MGFGFGQVVLSLWYKGGIRYMVVDSWYQLVIEEL